MTNANLTDAQLATLEIIRAAGGTVRRTWLGGWRDGVRGLRVEHVEALVALGVLAVTESRSTRATRRSRGMPSIERAYTIVA